MQVSLTAAWTVAWVVGIGIVLFAAIRISADYQRRDLDADLELYAMAVYGLAWIDEGGHFHDEYLLREPFLVDSPFEIWAVEPGDPPVIRLAPDSPRFEIASLGRIARGVVRTMDERTISGVDANGHRYRLHAIPSFDDSDVARMAIMVVGDTEPSSAAHARFVRSMTASSLAVALLGISIGAWLARRSLLPVAETYEQRERFLGGAAHELRNPVAGLRAVCESAEAGDESADQALARIHPIVLRTGALVENLLLYARLEADGTSPVVGDVRLDLLVEACVPDDGTVELTADECTISADARLVEVAVTNLLANAERHARRDDARAGVRVKVAGGRVTVEDDGPGFTPELLAHAAEPFVSSADSRGVGLGLALTRLIADLHGGELRLENRDGGGARVMLDFSSSDLS